VSITGPTEVHYIYSSIYNLVDSILKENLYTGRISLIYDDGLRISLHDNYVLTYSVDMFEPPNPHQYKSMRTCCIDRLLYGELSP
jgi:hypothetical protein